MAKKAKGKSKGKTKKTTKKKERGGSARKKYRDKVRKGVQKSAERTAETSEGDYIGILRPGLRSEGFEFFGPQSGSHMVDFIPFLHGEPSVKDAKAGDPDYILDPIYHHRGVGPQEATYICLAKTFGEPCPICEERNRLRKIDPPDKDLIEELRPKRRAIYLVYDHDDEEKGLQIWNVAFFFTEKPLQALVRTKKKRTGKTIYYADPDKGRHICFEIEGSGKKIKYTGHSFEKRDEPISDELLEEASKVRMEELLNIPTYEEVEEAFFGKGGRTEEDEDEEDEELDEDEELEDEDEEDEDEEDEDEEDEDEEDEDEEDEDEEDEDEEDEDEEDEDEEDED